MRILKIKPEHKPERADIPDTLEAMQEIVGGYIQAVYPFEEPVALICNEEGKLNGLPQRESQRAESLSNERSSLPWSAMAGGRDHSHRSHETTGHEVQHVLSERADLW